MDREKMRIIEERRIGAMQTLDSVKRHIKETKPSNLLLLTILKPSLRVTFNLRRALKRQKCVFWLKHLVNVTFHTLLNQLWVLDRNQLISEA